MSYSKLVTHINISPNKTTKRKYKITRITPHCSVCSVTIERLLAIFKPLTRRASCNYGIGNDGKVGLCVDEDDRSWCSSSKDNDNRAITIEVASSNKYPYTITDASLRSLINLMADICVRSNKNKIIWIADKNKALSYKLKDDEMLITVHRWFAKTACPGEYIYNKLDYIADEVNKILSSNVDITDDDPYIRYIVKRGDTLSRISRNYNVTISELARTNNIKNINFIKVGQCILIPKK